MQFNAETGEKVILPFDKEETVLDQGPMPSEIKREEAVVLMDVQPMGDQSVISYEMKQISSKKTSRKSVQKEDVDLPISVLAHQMILSRMIEKPIQIKVVVHINKMNLDGTAQTDLPDEILLQYHPQLRIGWGIVEGSFYDGKLNVTDIKFCEKEWCEDVS